MRGETEVVSACFANKSPASRRGFDSNITTPSCARVDGSETRPYTFLVHVSHAAAVTATHRSALLLFRDLRNECFGGEHQ